MTNYSISDLATEFAISTRTLRFYEEKGMLKPTRKGNNRIYSSADRTRLKLILRGKRIGFSLDESIEIINMYNPAKSNVKQLQTLIERIQYKRQKLQKQQQDIDMMLQDLNEIETVILKTPSYQP